MPSVMCSICVKSDETKKILFFHAFILFGWTMFQSLPYNKIKFDEDDKFKYSSKTSGDSDFGNIHELD